MGKRLVAGYGFNTSPSIFGSNAHNRSFASEGNAQKGIAFNFIHEGFIEYATSKNWVIGFNARYYKTTYDNPTILPERNTLEFNTKAPEGYYNITGLSYSVYFKIYNHKNVAPWGKYILFGPVLNTAKTNYDPNVMNIPGTVGRDNNYTGYSRYDTLITSFGAQTQAFKGFNIIMGFGRSRIFYNRLVLDYGFNFYLLSLFPNFLLTYNDKITPETYIEKTVHRRIRGINHCNVFLKVGFLLF